MMRRRVMIGLHVRSDMLLMCMRSGRVGIVAHRLVIMVVLCHCRCRRTEGHRRGSEALKRHRQQRDPHDQKFQDGFHAVILAYENAAGIPSDEAHDRRSVSRCCSAVSCSHVIFACARLIYMRLLVRTLMLWILIVSLPLQGIAATIKFPCTMAHSSMASPGAESMDSCDDSDMMAMPQPKATERASSVFVHQDVPCDQGEHQKHSSCRACAACCVGASAPPPFAFASFPVAHFANDYVAPASSFAGWIPSRIERPPRL